MEFIPGELLTPEEFELRAGDISTGQPQRSTNVATSRIRLVFPDEGTYMLAEDSIDYAETLYINRELRGNAGQPGLSGESEKAGHAFWYYSIQPYGGVAEIIRQASNFTHRDNGSHSALLVGSEENIRLYGNSRRSATATRCGNRYQIIYAKGESSADIVVLQK